MNDSLGISLIAVVVVLVFVGIFWFFKKRKPKANSITASLIKPQKGWIHPLKSLFSGPSRAIGELIPQIEEVLIQADVGVNMTAKLVASLDTNRATTMGDALGILKEQMRQQLIRPSPLVLSEAKPHVIFFVGINGTGKTTSIGKLAHAFKNQGEKVLVVGADTFRAAAGEQLKVWADRAGVDFVGGESEADPASVIHNGLSAALSRGATVALVDTAGRLHTKTSLMEELKKMQRVAAKVLGRDVNDFWLVLDATTGQNGLTQARVFTEALKLTGLILTKYDGTAKGGIILAINQELGLPVRYIGVGEGANDLKPFEPDEFIDELFDT